ncbi:hypothetical protein O181_015447 [Austropuccinia psidii MF-1]|uniref:pectinesterase n=1 Tax=Austropuccinia psidii MF-1 TaxID=1389203 RepID=A0A9Q3C259_9BASI|nr:hypothetical protein [Austropuccinia psidii MF-1]
MLKWPWSLRRTIQEAVNALRDLKGPQVILINPGTYNEQVHIEYGDPLTIFGKNPEDASNTPNVVTIRSSRSAKAAGSNSASATLYVKKDDFALYYINIINDFGNGTDTQALALSAEGLRHGYYESYFSSFQDTVGTFRGVHYFSKCWITGAVDFIFSKNVMAWFDQSAIAIQKGSLEPITASGRLPNDTLGFLVFNRVKVFSVGAAAKSAYLGRPWRKGSRVAFQNSYLGDVVHPDGWISWDRTEQKLDDVQFQEYGNHGPGSIGPRKYATMLAAPHLPEEILGRDYQKWVDPRFPPS